MSLSRRTSFWLVLFGLLLAALLRLPSLVTIPPGVHFDEAANGILAAEIGIEGERPIFIPSYTGKEVLFFYGAGLLARLVSPGSFSLRLTAAFAGLLTVAATYWLGRMLLLERRVALLATILLAASFWHLLFSRLGFRAITQPLLQALAVGLIWRSLWPSANQFRWGRLAAAGLCLGLLAYTYLAARLFPLALFVGLLPFLNPTDNNGAEPWLRRPGIKLALIGLVALIVVAPLLGYFSQNPETFWVRITQVGPTDSLSLGQSYRQTLSMLFLQGDPYWRFNLPGRPIFTAFWSAFLVIGWLLSFAALVRAADPVRRATHLLLCTLPFIMILPTALATNEIVPSNLRAIGLLPFIVYLPAYGFIQLLDSLTPQIRQLQGRQKLAQIALFALISLVMTAWSYQLYFRDWAGRSDVFYETEADIQAVADFLNENDFGDALVYVASPHYRHPALALQAQAYERLKWLPESQALALPADRAAWYIYPHASPQPDWVLDYISPVESVTGPAGPDGQPTFTAHHVAPVEPPGGFSLQDGNFGYQLNLLEIIVAEGEAGSKLPVTLVWRVTAPANANVQPFLHLVDGTGRRWSQLEPFAYPAEQWALGETVILKVDLPIPAGAPPQPYELKVGFFDSVSGQQLARLDREGRYAGANVTVPQVVVRPGRIPAPLPLAQVPVDEQVMPGLWLSGYERDIYRLSAGDRLDLDLWWLGRRQLLDFHVRLELVRPDNTGIILSTSFPVNDTFPGSEWAVPQFLRDGHAVQIPIDTEPGNYRLRLRVLNINEEAVYSTDLGPVSIDSSTRVFAPPRLSMPLAAVLGEEIALLGYDLAAIGEGQYELTLVWRALVPPAGDYTVFVHLLDQDGVCCLWQADLMPQQGSYPTSGWLADEVVVDTYIISVPEGTAPGDYPLEVGLFIADSGVRLVVEQPALPIDDKLFLRPLRLTE